MRFQWLKDYQDLEDQILYLKWNLNKSRLELSRWVHGDLAKVRLEKNSRSSSLEENIQRISREIELLEEQRTELIAIVASFKGLDSDIVRMKYIEGCSLEIISEEVGYSASYVRQRHAEIRKKIQFLDEYESNYSTRRERLVEIDQYNRGCAEKKQISLF